MTTLEEIKIGSIVVFDPKMYEPPYSPYYDEYKNHVFKVISYMKDGPEIIDDHLLLKCEDDPSIIVGGYVHDDELICLDNVTVHVTKYHRYIQALQKFTK